jgi:hypothetical protein
MKAMLYFVNTVQCQEICTLNLLTSLILDINGASQFFITIGDFFLVAHLDVEERL